MSQTLLNEDLNVISNSDLEITLLDGNFNIIQQLDDEPNDVGGLTAAELKAKFDESGLIIQKYINETLIPELVAADAVEIARIRAENQRAANEELRIENERVRSEAEKQRVDSTTGIVSQATAQAKEAKKQADRAEAAASGGNHASRHALSGPDPITAADIGAAPSGFGLGATGSNVIRDANEATNNGWYQMHGNAVNCPQVSYGAYCSILVQSRSKSDIVQWAITMNGPWLFRRVCSKEVWGEWEWVDPPLALNTEYRTTQRYLGKPVYAKTVEIGGLPNNAVKNHRFVAEGVVDKIVSCVGTATDTTTGNNVSLPAHLGSTSNINTFISIHGSAKGYIVATTFYDMSSYDSCIATVKYTKLAD